MLHILKMTPELYSNIRDRIKLFTNKDLTWLRRSVDDEFKLVAISRNLVIGECHSSLPCFIRVGKQELHDDFPGAPPTKGT